MSVGLKAVVLWSMYLYSAENIGMSLESLFADCYVSYLVSDIDRFHVTSSLSKTQN